MQGPSVDDFGKILQLYATNVLVALPFAGLLVWLLWRNWLVDLATPLKIPRQPGWAKGACGLALGAVMVLLAVLPAWLGRGFDPQQLGWQAFEYLPGAKPGAGAAFGMAALFGVQSLFEELLFRVVAMLGFALLLMWQASVLYRLSSASTNPAPIAWRAKLWFWCGVGSNLVIALAFSVVHMNNPSASPISGVGIALAGLLLGQLCWNQGALWGAWGAHWTWNLSLALLGLPVSGMALVPTPLGIGAAGAVPGLLTGGSFGPEASLGAQLVLLAVFAHLLRQAWRSARALW